MNKNTNIFVTLLIVVVALGLGSYYLKKQTEKQKSLHYVSAMSILQDVPEIQLLQQDIVKVGRTTFFKAGDENGDVVKIWLYEDGFPDNHTTRIDTFNVNIKTKVITIDDVAMISGKEFMTLEEWKKTIKGRFQ